MRAGFDDADEATAGDESDDGEDFAPDDDEDLNAELNDLQNDLNDNGNEEGDVSAGATALGKRITRSRRSPKGLGLLKLIDENGTPFIGQYENPLLDMYAEEEPFPTQPPLKVRKRNSMRSAQRARGNAHTEAPESSASPKRISRRSSTGSTRSVHFEDAEPATPATIREYEASDEDEDDDFELADVDESDKENAEPQAEQTDSGTHLSESPGSSPSISSEHTELSDSEVDSEETSSSESSPSDSSSDLESEQLPSNAGKQQSDTSETSSSGSSSSDSSSELESEQLRSNDVGQQPDSSETSSSDSSSSSSDSEPDMTNAKIGKAEARKETLKQQWARENVMSKPAEENADPAPSISSRKTVAPGQGKPTTRNRNQRRRESMRLAALKKEGILPAAATKADLRRFNEENSGPMRTPRPVEAPEDEVEMPQTTDDANITTAFEDRRRALLASIASGGIDVSPGAHQHEKKPEKSSIPDEEQQPELEAPRTDTEVNYNGGAMDPEAPAPAVVPKEPTNDAPPSPEEVQVGEPKKVPTLDLSETPAPAMSETPKELQAAAPEQVSMIAPREKSTPAISETPKENPTFSAQHRRSRLDLPGTKRMLFGSLGLRTPKTKEDESKMRDKLMKDVKPVKQPQSDKEAEAVDIVAAAAADNSWKEKIDLRAVECCHEGVELSTPPFPFVQRWDPQQQGGYNYGTGKKRKGKKRKRNNDSYHEDNSYQDSHSKAARHRQYDSPGHELHYGEQLEEGSAEPRDLAQESDQQQIQVDRQDSLAASEQLLRENEDVSPDTLNETPDLPALPKDPTTCPALTRDTAKTGTVVAFKQFQMGLETNWQPIVSDYRTAIVDEVSEDGSLLMTPAKRDRPAKEALYDDETGDRIYGKFDMPGYDEEKSVNDSRIELKFDELISPILVRTAEGMQDAQAEQLEEPAKDSESSFLQSAAEDDLAHNHPHSTASQPGLDGATDEGMDDGPIEPGEETRAEISELIRDAGWRSSVGPGVNGSLEASRDDQDLESRDDVQGIPPEDFPSPAFHGFTSSPPFSSVQVQSSPMPDGARATNYLHASGTEVAESVPPQDHNDTEAQSVVSNVMSAVDYPELPQMGDDNELVLQEGPQIDDDSDFFPQEAQDRSVIVDPEHSSLSQELNLNGMDQSPAQSTRSHTRPSLEHSSPIFKAPHPIDSDDDSLPPLFSQAWERRMSQEPSIKAEQFSSQEDAIDSISPPSRRKSKFNGRKASSQGEFKRTARKPEVDDLIESDGEITPRPAQRPSQVMSSRVIDLTISSDAVNPPDSQYAGGDDDDDSHIMPKGPGWVKKTRTSYSSSAPAKANSGRRKTKST